jgi:hypothetical protein
MNLRNALCAAVLAIPVMVAGAAPSMADTDVNVRFGVGLPGFGYSHYPYYDDSYIQRPYGRLSCWQAKQLVRDRGFHRVRAIECNGRVYTFEAVRRGRIVMVNVNARTGAVWRS